MAEIVIDQFSGYADLDAVTALQLCVLPQDTDGTFELGHIAIGTP